MKKTYTGSCHCGFVQFEVDADIDHVRICNCSVCHKRGALNSRVRAEDLRLLTPWEDLSTYRWGSMTACDYFCPKCGILPFRKPSVPTEAEIAEGSTVWTGYAVNTRCLDGFDPSKVGEYHIDRRDTPIEDVIASADQIASD